MKNREDGERIDNKKMGEFLLFDMIEMGEEINKKMWHPHLMISLLICTEIKWFERLSKLIKCCNFMRIYVYL